METTMNHFGKEFGGDQLERRACSEESREAHAIASTGVAGDDGGTDCTEILHDLGNVLSGMLVNAQVMQWKLPAYSHSKRYVREIERGAQRGGSLLQQLIRRLAALQQSQERVCGEAPHLAGAVVAVTAQEPNGEMDRLADQPLSSAPRAAPAFSLGAVRRSHSMM
jgi:hypothetical protein